MGDALEDTVNPPCAQPSDVGAAISATPWVALALIADPRRFQLAALVVHRVDGEPIAILGAVDRYDDVVQFTRFVQAAPKQARQFPAQYFLRWATIGFCGGRWWAEHPPVRLHGFAGERRVREDEKCRISAKEPEALEGVRRCAPIDGMAQLWSELGSGLAAGLECERCLSRSRLKRHRTREQSQCGTQRRR